MIQNTIQNFLNLPGVISLGIILFQTQTQPYFCYKDQTFREEQESLTQSIIRIISNTVKNTEGVDFLEFPVRKYYAYTLKIDSEVILLVLTLRDMAAIKLLAAKQLQVVLRSDIEQTITTFQILANNSLNTGNAVTTDENKCVDILAEQITIQDFLNILNHISQFTSNYLGSKLTLKCWQLTRPNEEWLENFQINHFPEIAFSGAVTEYISPQQKQWLKEWALGFIRQGSQIINNLPILIEKKCLTKTEINLLSNHIN